MKTLFLASSFAQVADLFLNFTGGLCRGKTVTFIPTASIPETVTFYVAAGRAALKDLGLLVDELEISTAPREEIVHKLRNNDYVYLTGGNAFFLLQELRRTGADELLTKEIESGKSYVGESAGSVVLSPNIEYVKTLDTISAAPLLESFSSLALIDFYPLPHFTNFPFKERVEEVISIYGKQLPLRPFSNTQAITVKDGQVCVLGA